MALKFEKPSTADYQIPADISTPSPFGDFVSMEGYFRKPSSPGALRLIPKSNDPINFVEFPFSKVLWLFTNPDPGYPVLLRKSTVYVDSSAHFTFPETPTLVYNAAKLSPTGTPFHGETKATQRSRTI